MKFFDLHFHPVLKTLFKEQYHALSAWEVIHIPHAYRINGMESQSSLEQVSVSGMNLLCITRHPIEMGMVDQWMLRLASNIYTQFEKSRLNKMANGADDNDYNLVLNDEWTNLNKTADGKHPKKIHILSSLSEYKEDDPDTLYVFFNLEGGHIFYGNNNKYDHITAKTIEDKFTELQKTSKLILYFTPTHLTPNVFINHAYGNKILSRKFFFPQSFGISTLGYELINITYSKNILIDVKHMSLVSRKQFYKHHQDHFPGKPIIASHVGLAGHTWIDLYKRIKRKKIARLARVVKIYMKKTQGHLHKIINQKTEGYLNDTYFNPNSINLYDEEIENILNSFGLIGLIFDIRILGGQRNLSGGIKKFETEFLYLDEYYEWHNTGDSKNIELANRFDEEYAETEDDMYGIKKTLLNKLKR